MSVAQTSAPWKHMYEKDNITVYYRKSPESSIHELKLTTTVNASLSSVVHLLQDVKAYPEWVYRTVSAHEIKEISPRETYYYVVSDFPWPLTNRDYVAHNKLSQDKKTKIVTSNSVASPTVLTEKKEFVRIKEMKTEWKFTPLSNGFVNVTYTLQSNPGGNLPDWLINLAVDKGPYETLLKFKALLQEEKYRKVKVAYIQDI